MGHLIQELNKKPMYSQGPFSMTKRWARSYIIHKGGTVLTEVAGPNCGRDVVNVLSGDKPIRPGTQWIVNRIKERNKNI